jgi:hypothetical protein
VDEGRKLVEGGADWGVRGDLLYGGSSPIRPDTQHPHLCRAVLKLRGEDVGAGPWAGSGLRCDVHHGHASIPVALPLTLHLMVAVRSVVFGWVRDSYWPALLSVCSLQGGGSMLHSRGSNNADLDR